MRVLLVALLAAISYAQTGPLDRFASFFGMDSDEFAVGQEAAAGTPIIPANPEELKSAVVSNELNDGKSVDDRLKDKKEAVVKQEEILKGLNEEKTQLLGQLEKQEAEIEKANSNLRLANGELVENEEEKKMALTQGATQVLMTAQKDLKAVESASEQQTQAFDKKLKETVEEAKKEEEKVEEAKKEGEQRVEEAKKGAEKKKEKLQEEATEMQKEGDAKIAKAKESVKEAEKIKDDEEVTLEKEQDEEKKEIKENLEKKEQVEEQEKAKAKEEIKTVEKQKESSDDEVTGEIQEAQKEEDAEEEKVQKVAEEAQNEMAAAKEKGNAKIEEVVKEKQKEMKAEADAAIKQEADMQKKEQDLEQANEKRLEDMEEKKNAQLKKINDQERADETNLKDQGKLKAKKAAQDATDKVATQTAADITKMESEMAQKEASEEQKLRQEAAENTAINTQIEEQKALVKKYKKETHDLKTAATNLHVDFHTNIQNMFKQTGHAGDVKWTTPGFASLNAKDPEEVKPATQEQSVAMSTVVEVYNWPLLSGLALSNVFILYWTVKQYQQSKTYTALYADEY